MTPLTAADWPHVAAIYLEGIATGNEDGHTIGGPREMQHECADAPGTDAVTDPPRTNRTMTAPGTAGAGLLFGRM